MNGSLESLYLDTLLEKSNLKDSIFKNVTFLSNIYANNLYAQSLTSTSYLSTSNIKFNYPYTIPKTLGITSGNGIFNSLNIPNLGTITNITCSSVCNTELTSIYITSKKLSLPYITCTSTIVDTVKSNNFINITSPIINIYSSNILNIGTSLNILSTNIELSNKIISLNYSGPSFSDSVGIYLYNGSYIKYSASENRYKIYTPYISGSILTVDTTGSVYISNNTILNSVCTVGSLIKTNNITCSSLISPIFSVNNGIFDTISVTSGTINGTKIINSISNATYFTCGTMICNTLTTSTVSVLNQSHVTLNSILLYTNNLNVTNISINNNLSCNNINISNITVNNNLFITNNSLCNVISSNSIITSDLILMPNLLNLTSNSAAISAGIPIGGLYRTGDIIRVRL
jgi:hypothetical protein